MYLKVRFVSPRKNMITIARVVRKYRNVIFGKGTEQTVGRGGGGT